VSEQSRASFLRSLAICAGTLVIIVILDGSIGALMAQNPFGAPRPSGGEPQMGGIVGWLLAKQSEFYREISSTIRAGAFMRFRLRTGSFTPPALATARP
jgi:nickel/cobalt exporter